MIENLNFIERVILLIGYMICFVGLVACACGLWRVQRGFGAIVKRLNARICLYESKNGNKDS